MSHQSPATRPLDGRGWIGPDWVGDGFKVSGSDLSGLLVDGQAVLRLGLDVELLFEDSAVDSGGVRFVPMG